MRLLRALRRHQRGATAVEFAMILLPLCIMILAGIELGYRIYAEAILNGTLREASRLASTGSFDATYINNYVTTQMQQFNRAAQVNITTMSYADYNSVNNPEPILSGSVASGHYCWTDINGNGAWDSDMGKTGYGNPNDVIDYDVIVKYPALTTMFSKVFNLGGLSQIEASTLLSNEPFAPYNTTTPAKLCK